MLPADCAQRLVALFTKALEDCTEQRRKLQQRIQQCRTLLGDWNSESEHLAPEESRNENQAVETEPSAEELEELELLNKALEKALRVRSKFQPVPGEAIKGSRAADEKPETQQDPAGNPKEAIPEKVRLSPVSRKFVSSSKPTAYMLKAPYKTERNVKRPPGKTSAGRNSRMAKAPGKKLSPASPKRKQLTKTAEGGRQRSHSASEPGLQRVSSKCSKPAPLPATSVEAGKFAETHLLVPKTDPVVKSLGGPSPPEKEIPAKGTAPRTFTLQENGSSLKLPLPYQRAFAKYVRLLEKCQRLKATPESTAAKSRFLEKLQSTFLSPEPAFTPAEVRQELGHLWDLHSLVTQHMQAESPAALGESLTWERQYESLLALQSLQAVAEQGLDKVQQMREAMAAHAEFLPPLSVCSSDGDDGDVLPIWQACLEKQMCWDPAFVGPPPLLFYSSLDELKDMEALKLQVAMLNQKVEIQTAMEKELIPLLEPGRLPESCRPSVIRAAYSLLCEGGERFPVLVKDE